MTIKNYLITGGAGFIGSHFAIKIAQLGHKAIVLDALTYAANMQNLAEIKNLDSCRIYLYLLSLC